MQDKIWWLIENQLGGMRKPEKEKIGELYENGLRAVASFLETDENISEYEAAGFQVLWLPIEDDTPPTIDQVRKFSHFVDKMKAMHMPLAAHCLGGNGRAGTMLAAYFINRGEDAAEVLHNMREINPKAVRTSSQEAFLFSL